MQAMETNMKVQKLMTRPVVTCRECEPLDQVARAMAATDCGSIPVVNRNNEILGMITDRDIMMAASTSGQSLSEIQVAEVADGNVYAVSPTDSVREAEKRMREHQVRRLPVVEDEKVVGIITLGDIAREAYRERRARHKAISSDDVMQTLAAVSEPRESTAGEVGRWFA